MPCFLLIKFSIYSIGPGLYNEIIAIISSNLSGDNFFRYSLTPLLSSWKHPIVFPFLKRSNVFVSFKVIESDAVVKGQTATSSYKHAVLERNIKTSVPPFIKIGDEVIINTNDASYVERAKK